MDIGSRKVKSRPFAVHWIWNRPFSWLTESLMCQFHANHQSSIANHWKLPGKLLTHLPQFPYLYNEANTSTYIPELLRRLNKVLYVSIEQCLAQWILIHRNSTMQLEQSNNDWAPLTTGWRGGLDDIYQKWWIGPLPNLWEWLIFLHLYSDIGVCSQKISYGYNEKPYKQKRVIPK